MTFRRWCSILWLSVAAAPLLVSTTALAQPASEPALQQASPVGMEEAKERFERGLRLYEDANYEAARVEFERAYALAPSWKLLYNIGYCYRHLNDYVGAISALEKFLAEGKGEIPAERVQGVETTLNDLKTRIATIEVVTNVSGATVTIDDVPVGTSPLHEPVTVNPGRRKVSATAPGAAPVIKVLTLAGRESQRVELNLNVNAQTRTIIVEKKTNIVPYVAWGVTGVFAVGTVITGILALNAEKRQEDALHELGTTPAEQQKKLSDARSETNRIGTVTDILLGSTVVAAGVATFFTIKALGRDKDKKEAQLHPTHPSVRAGFAGTGLSLSGQF